MPCPRCGKPIPNGAAFCPSCGLATAAPPPRPAVPTAPTSVAADFDAQRRRNRWVIAGVSLAAVVAAFFGARAMGFLQLGAASPKPSLQVRAEGPAPALQLPTRVDPLPVKQGAARVTMPDDVAAWLRHLEACEGEKNRISADQTAQVMVLMQKMQVLGAGMAMLNDAGELDPGSDENKEPGAYARDKVLDFRPPWTRLVEYFNSYPPPPECRPLASDFNRALSEVPGVMGDLGNLLDTAAKDPTAALKAANGMKNTSAGEIDRYFGTADAKLGEICAKYDTQKWFAIKTDVGGSPLSMFGNLGGGGLGR